MPSQNIPALLGTFVDGTVVTAGTTSTTDTGGSTLNPKMELIRSVVNDHATRIDTLTAQVSSLGGLVFNPITYGADVTGVTDSTAAIQSCINAAVAQQGIVVFSNGLYKLTDTLNVTGTCYITSDGAGQGVILFQTVSSKSIFNISSDYVRITDLKMDYQAAASSTTAMIYRTVASATYLTGIVIQRCQFYSSTSKSFIAISIPFIQASLISDCSYTATLSSGYYFLGLTGSQNVSVSRNVCTFCSAAVFLAAKTYNTINKNIVIDQNTITSYNSNAIVMGECANIFVNKNVFSSCTGGTGISAVRITPSSTPYASFVSITENLIDHTSDSLGTTVNSGVYSLGCSYLNVSENYFYYGKNLIYLTGYLSAGTAGYNSTISNNVFIRPASAAIYTGDFGGSLIVRANKIVDVIDTSATGNSFAIQNACVSTVSSVPVANCMIVANNTLGTIGTTGYTGNMNNYGLYISNGSTTQKTLTNGNDFSIAATSSYYDVNLSIFTESVTGDRIVRSTGSAAPTTGTWKVGDQVVLDSPTAGGYIGYVCTTAGTPGTWKGYGAIQA